MQADGHLPGLARNEDCPSGQHVARSRCAIDQRADVQSGAQRTRCLRAGSRWAGRSGAAAGSRSALLLVRTAAAAGAMASVSSMASASNPARARRGLARDGDVDGMGHLQRWGRTARPAHEGGRRRVLRGSPDGTTRSGGAVPGPGRQGPCRSRCSQRGGCLHVPTPRQGAPGRTPRRSTVPA